MASKRLAEISESPIRAAPTVALIESCGGDTLNQHANPAGAVEALPLPETNDDGNDGNDRWKNECKVDEKNDGVSQVNTQRVYIYNNKIYKSVGDVQKVKFLELCRIFNVGERESVLLSNLIPNFIETSSNIEHAHAFKASDGKLFATKAEVEVYEGTIEKKVVVMPKPLSFASL